MKRIIVILIESPGWTIGRIRCRRGRHNIWCIGNPKCSLVREAEARAVDDWVSRTLRDL